MKKMLAIILASSVLASMAFAAPKKAAVNSGEGMAGKLGIGSSSMDLSVSVIGPTVNVPGIGVRYWFSDNMGLDANLGFLFGKDSNQFGLGATLPIVIRKTSNVRFLFLPGLQFLSGSLKSNNVDYKMTDIIVGAGLGAEYFFTEAPELSINAFMTGFGVDIKNTSAGNDSTSETIFGTNAKLSFGVRYYF